MKKELRFAALRVLRIRRREHMRAVGKIDDARAGLVDAAFRVEVKPIGTSKGIHGRKPDKYIVLVGADLAHTFKTAIRQYALENNRADLCAKVVVCVMSRGHPIELPGTSWNDLYNKYITCPYCKGHHDGGGRGCVRCSLGKFTPRREWLCAPGVKGNPRMRVRVGRWLDFGVKGTVPH